MGNVCHNYWFQFGLLIYCYELSAWLKASWGRQVDLRNIDNQRCTVVIVRDREQDVLCCWIAQRLRFSVIHRLVFHHNVSVHCNICLAYVLLRYLTIEVLCWCVHYHFFVALWLSFFILHHINIPASIRGLWINASSIHPMKYKPAKCSPGNTNCVMAEIYAMHWKFTTFLSNNFVIMIAVMITHT